MCYIDGMKNRNYKDCECGKPSVIAESNVPTYEYFTIEGKGEFDYEWQGRTATGAKPGEFPTKWYCAECYKESKHINYTDLNQDDNGNVLGVHVPD
jgi:hypothetical protein